jgi:hypothetical protein
MGEVRRLTVRRWTTGMVAASFLVALAGCEGDRTSNADDRKPIGVTASGVEIVEVVRNEKERIVEAVVVAGGEERQVTLAPVLDGPLPSGMTATVRPTGDDGPVELAYGWDEHSGATWFRQDSDGDTIELTRTTVQGRVVEDYVFGDRSLRVVYADLSPVVLDKAIDKHLRGESLDGASPEVVEFAGAMRAFEEFAAQLPSTFASENEDAALLTSLLADPVFAGAIVGEDVTPNRPDALCNAFNICAALTCRFLPYPNLCAACAAGVLACMFMDWFCSAWCGD